MSDTITTFHIRTAGMLVKAANEVEGDVTYIASNGERCNAKSVSSLMGRSIIDYSIETSLSSDLEKLHKVMSDILFESSIDS